jgi:pimeloyl-ACP methyl ester carboxylesterase
MYRPPLLLALILNLASCGSVGSPDSGGPTSVDDDTGASEDDSGSMSSEESTSAGGETGGSTEETGVPECEFGAEPTVHLGNFISNEPVAETPEENKLGLLPLPNIDRSRWFWVYTPGDYDPGCPPPVVIALHPRGSLPSFSSSVVWSEDHLIEYATQTLDLWRPIADENGVMLIVPLGDPDILWMGLTWLAGPRTELVSELLDTVSAQLPFDERRVYLVGSGEGGHVALATAARAGELFAAVAAVNPPLFDGSSPIPYKGRDMILPRTIPEMIDQAGPGRTPMYVRAGDGEADTDLTCHGNNSLPDVCRFRDSSAIAFDHYETVVESLDAEFPVTLAPIPGPHYRPADAEDVTAMWDFLRVHELD